MTAPYPNSGLGSKFLAVFGELSLVGKPRPVLSAGQQWWAQLAATAFAGDTTIALPATWATEMGLIPGDELVLAPSGLVWNESETVTIAGLGNASFYAPGTIDFVLGAGLQYSHRGLTNTSWLGAYDLPFLAAEVALLRAADQRINNVVVEGMHEAGQDPAQHFGVSTYLFQKTDKCPKTNGGRPAEASANISGVLFQSCGQRNYPTRACLSAGPQQQGTSRPRFEWDVGATKALHIADLTIADGYNTGVQLDRVHGASVEGVVAYNVQRHGILVEGQGNVIRRNLIISVDDPFDKAGGEWTGRWASRWSAGTAHVYGIFHMGRGGVVSGNTVAGTYGMAYSVDGHECGAAPTIDDNIAHSAPMGVWYEMRDEQLGGMARV